MKALAFIFLVMQVFLLSPAIAQQKKGDEMMKDKKVLFVLTNHDTKGASGEPTGFYLSEAAHPWHVLHKAGVEVDFVSPRGGKPPVDGFDLNDSINAEFWHNEDVQRKLSSTKNPSEIVPTDYDAIHYVGGHGAMWDFPDDATLQHIAASIYEHGGIVAAVCHGPAGLVNIKLSDGDYLVKGKKVTGFTNEEEKAVKLQQIVPFLLQSKLEERGAEFNTGEKFKENVVEDGRLITGQNPASATALGEALLKALKAQEAAAH